MSHDAMVWAQASCTGQMNAQTLSFWIRRRRAGTESAVRFATRCAVSESPCDKQQVDVLLLR